MRKFDEAVCETPMDLIIPSLFHSRATQRLIDTIKTLSTVDLHLDLSDFQQGDNENDEGELYELSLHMRVQLQTALSRPDCVFWNHVAEFRKYVSENYPDWSPGDVVLLRKSDVRAMLWYWWGIQNGRIQNYQPTGNCLWFKTVAEEGDYLWKTLEEIGAILSDEQYQEAMRVAGEEDKGKRLDKLNKKAKTSQGRGRGRMRGL